MNEKKQLLVELSIPVLFLTWWFFFVATNVSPNLGNIYIGLALSGAIIALVDYQFGKKSLKLVNPNHSWITVLFAALVAYVVLILGDQFVVSKIAAYVPIGDLLKQIASATPVFANSVIINFFTYSFPIAFIETYTIFFVGYDLLASLFNVEIDKKNLTNPKLLGIIFGLSILFLMLHVTAKGIDNNAALLLVFFMAVISLVLITIFKEGRVGIMFHIIPNSIGMAALLGIKLLNFG